MSAANMGISQLECLQLRRLVGPTGIGTVGSVGVGSPFGDVVVALVPMIIQPDGKTKSNAWVSPFTVPSGTGMIRVTVQIRTTNGLPFYYQIGCGEFGTTLLPSVSLYDAGVGLQGYAGFWAEGLIMYSNPSSAPAPIELIVGAAGSTINFELINFAVKAMSFGPYVNQG